jgi:hypothetical protein
MVPEPAGEVAEGRTPQGRAEETGRTGEGRRHREARLQGRDGGAQRRDGQGTAAQSDAYLTDIINSLLSASTLKIHHRKNNKWFKGKGRKPLQAGTPKLVHIPKKSRLLT